MTRASLEALDGQQYDVAVIGGGAVGCATARELAGRGFKTLLLERGDFGSGTSSRSSRMLYSGVGYLAPDFPLWQIPLRPLPLWRRFLYARNIMHCRAELVADMPHRLTKHRFHYPFRPGDQYPGWLIDIGFRLMEASSSRGVPLAYRKLTHAQAAQESAMVADLGGTVSSVAVFEEFMYAWPERMCVDTALDAQLRGAELRTYAKVEQVAREGQQWALQLQEMAPQQTGAARVRARAVVNAASPWVDRVRGAEGATKRVLGKKGVNLMVRLPEAWRGQGLEAFSSKGEPFYVFPWRDLHFIGPTEALVTQDPDEVRVLDAEIDYILGEANILFPGLKLDRQDVLHCWCGVRPMSTLDGQSVSLPVRAIEDASTPGLITVTGSYIMMHRHAARLAAEAVQRHLGPRDAPPQGMLVQPPDERDERHWPDIIAAQHVVCLSDLIRRRLPHGLDPQLGRDRAEPISHQAAAVLGWSEAHRQLQLRRFEEETDWVYGQA